MMLIMLPLTGAVQECGEQHTPSWLGGGAAAHTASGIYRHKDGRQVCVKYCFI